MAAGPHTSTLVGRYEILREIGRGGMAVVFLARQTDLERFVALKQLNASDPRDPSFAQRFVREAKLAGSLSHPNIVTVYDYFEHEGTPYIAMEYVERGSLRPYIGRLTLAQIGGVLEGLLAGLAHGEQHGIVHRDLKPENLMVTTEGRVKIADFGIAKATNRMQSSAFLTATGTTVGTPTYMAPEQAMAQEIGPSTDLYSVGCMAFELFTGKPPFYETEAPMALLLRHVNEPIPAVKSVRPGVDPRISDWIERLLVKDPAQRTQSAGEAWDELEEIIISLLGPRWRRDARLGEVGEEREPTTPLTPAPFDSAESVVPSPSPSDEFQTFSWGGQTSESGADSAAAVTPPPSPPPGRGMEVAPVEAAAEPEAPEDEGFVTYVAPPAAVPPVESGPAALVAPVPPPPVAAAASEPVTPPPPAPPEPEPEPAVAAPPEPLTPPPPLEPPLAALAATVTPPAPPPPSARPAPPAEPPHGRRLLIPLVALGLLLAVLAVVMLGGGGAEKKAPAPTAGTLTTGPLSLQTPTGWKQLDRAPATPGLTLRSAVAAATTSGGGSIVLALAGDAADRPSLLPSGIAPSKRTVTRLGNVTAYRYDGVGAGRLTVFVAPTAAGVATVACIKPTADCIHAATTLTVTGTRVFPLGASRTYARVLNRSLGSLRRATLRGAKTPKAQAAAAARIAAAYRHAAVLLSGLRLSPADRGLNAQLTSALNDGQRAYAALAVAARGSQRKAYGAAAKRVASAERRVAAAQRALSAAGYGSLLTAKFEPAAVPSLARKHTATAKTVKPQATPQPQPTAQPQPTTTAVPQRTAQPTPPKRTPTPVSGGGDTG